MGPYLDTSALAKWYLNEPFSEAFEAYIQKHPTATIGRLTVVEFRCLLARRRRAGEITKAIESRVCAAFEKDVSTGSLQVVPVADAHPIAALGLIEQLRRIPLRTLDALHPAIALGAQCRQLAAADKTMADAGKAAGLGVARFFWNGGVGAWAKLKSLGEGAGEGISPHQRQFSDHTASARSGRSKTYHSFTRSVCSLLGCGLPSLSAATGPRLKIMGRSSACCSVSTYPGFTRLWNMSTRRHCQ